ncbi:hypothetical protein V8F20_011800 [Naviculisporaceae sp. PSN 640]
MKSLFRSALHRPPPAIRLRNIKPRDVRKPSLATLNQDVVTLVIRFLYDMDPDSVLDVSMVCSALYVCARYVQHQHTHLDLAHKHVLEQLQSISRNGFLPAVRELHVMVDNRVRPSVGNVREPLPKSREDRKRRKHQLQAWHLLCDLIPLMSGLSRLHWTGAVIPDRLVEYLKTAPQIRLDLTIHHSTESIRFSEEHYEQLALLEQLASKLSGNQNISSLRINLQNNASEHARDMMQGPFKQLLLSSPSLHSLSLKIALREDGCVVGIPGMGSCSFHLANGEAPSNPLQELEIIGYHWGTPRHQSMLAEMDYWRTTFDWSQLRRLVLHNRLEYEYRCIQLAEFLAPHLVSLEEVELGADLDNLNNHDLQVIQNFFNLLASRGLKSISIPSTLLFAASIPAIFATHAETLQSLTIYPEPLSHSFIVFQLKGLPQLRTLSLVCVRDNAPSSWPDETFSLLASIPHLQQLTIWFDIGPDTAPFQPYLNVSSAGDIYSHLRRHGAAQLQLLRLHSGFPPRPLRGFHSLDAEWQFDSPSSFVCKTTQDINGNSSFQVSCTKLSRAQNERLRLDAAQGKVNKQDANSMKYMIALKGPMTLEEWRNWRDHQWQKAQKPWYAIS